MHKCLTPALAHLRDGEHVVLCTVIRTLGSTPREIGARMLVSKTKQWQTIGGGRLEWEVAEQAQALLMQAPEYNWLVRRYALGPSLGQCCGGTVEILFEYLDASDIPVLENMLTSYTLHQAVQRHVELYPQQHRHSYCIPATHSHSSFIQAEQNFIWQDVLQPAPLHIYLFGAGHVGNALIHILGTLPCRVCWIDQRAEQFPSHMPENVTLEATDIPEAIIEQAPANSYFLVMTHNHDLDLHLCLHILRHTQPAYLGLIGSLTKRARFLKRLQQQGCSPQQLDALVCPMGIPGIEGKAPALIAVAVAAEILQHAQALQLLPTEKQSAKTLSQGPQLTHV